MHARATAQDGLRRVLLLDAAATAAMGLLLAVLASPLAGYFSLPVPLLRWAGVGLLPFAALLAYLATRPRISTRAARVIILANALWVVDSVLLLASGWVSPTTLGTGFVLAQAAAVALFAWLEHASLRRAPRLAPS